jgi:hypothetical protein
MYSNRNQNTGGETDFPGGTAGNLITGRSVTSLGTDQNTQIRQLRKDKGDLSVWRWNTGQYGDTTCAARNCDPVTLPCSDARLGYLPGR